MCVRIYVYVCMYGCLHACIYVCMCVCMHSCMYICILKRLPPLPPTSETRGMDAWILGCLFLWSPVGRLGTKLGCILEAFGHLWCHFGWSLQACGSNWARLGQAGYPNEPFGTPVQAGTPIEGDLLGSGPGGLAACGGLLRASRSLIEEDKMIR